MLAQSGGGEHSADNYLPAHQVCNNYRWDYLPEEFQEILRMGVWIRTQVQERSKIGQLVGDAYLQHERKRISRRAGAVE